MRRLALLLGLAAALMSVAGIVALANHVPGGGGHLVGVGPVSSEDGFPTFYRDENDVALALCIDVDDPNCGLAGTLPDPAQPVSFPDNYPDEAFYQLSSAQLSTGGGAGRASLVLALEAAFANGGPAAGDQIVFGRVRYIMSGLTPGATYHVTHPYGSDDVVAQGGTRNVFFSEDIGLTPGNFGEALGSRIGPFLRWDPSVAPAAPTGYLGDPAVEHRISGSPFGTNVFRVEGPNVGGPGINVIETNLFNINGKLATRLGVDVVRATYSRAAGSPTGGMVDVFASSAPDQSVQMVAPDVALTRLHGAGRRYFGRAAFTGATPPASIEVTNAGDRPVSVKSAPVTDRVDIARAQYDADTHLLTIDASSSDAADPPLLHVNGFGDLTDGHLSVDAGMAPPFEVTVASAAGGTATLPVTVVGAPFDPIPVVAFAGVDQSVQQGQAVELDGSQSTGPVESYSWEQVGGPAVTLSGATTAKPGFSAPAEETDLTFELTVTGTGGPSTDTVVVHVLAVTAPVADAGPDQTVARGSRVTLDGSGSTGASEYLWTQLSGTPVTLSSPSASAATFTFPDTPNPLSFRLQVTGPGGAATDTVVISPVADTLTVAKARFVQQKAEWDIAGTATQTFGNRVTIHLGGLTGPVVGVVDVDALGAWRFRQAGSTVRPTATVRTLTLESSQGGRLEGVPVEVK